MLISIYIIFNNINIQNWLQYFNIFIIVLNFYKVSFKSIIKFLITLKEFNKGIIMEINRK